MRFQGSGFTRLGSGRLGSVPDVWTEPVLATRGIKKVPGSGDSVPKVPKVALYFERALLYFESKLLYFESILPHFESLLL